MKQIKLNSIFKSFLVIGSFIASSSLFATSFDCSKATQKSEKMVCDSPVLSSLDDKMFSLYQKAKADSSNPESLKQAQIAWIKQMRTCNDESCMVNLYNQRINELSPSNTPVVTSIQPVRIEDNKQSNSAINNQSDVKNIQDTKAQEVQVLPVEPPSVITESPKQEIQSGTNQSAEIKNNNQNNSDDGFGVFAYILGTLLTLFIILLPLILKRFRK